MCVFSLLILIMFILNGLKFLQVPILYFVISGPPTARSPLNLTAVSGTSIYLRCPVSGFPITSTTWFSGNEVISDQNSRKVFSNGTLLLSNLEEEKDKGKITCNVYNQQGMMAVGVIFLNIMGTIQFYLLFHRICISALSLLHGGKEGFRSLRQWENHYRTPNLIISRY